MATFDFVPYEMTATLNFSSEIVIRRMASMIYCSCFLNVSPWEL